MKNFVDRTLKRFHESEGGAIMLLLLAAFLILFMVALTLYDSGQAARDKMDAQIAADASAFSHSVVKSRSMNMIVYANIIKRMFFSYAVTYVNGLAALLLTLAEHIALCARMCGPVPCPRLQSCWELIENVLLYTSEIIEAPFDLSTLGLIPGDPLGNHVTPELEALERYQQYMFSITPWWAWAENVLRSMNNGAMVTATWPPPAGNIIEQVKGYAINTLGTIDWGLGTNLLGMLPSFTKAVDALPVTRRDRQTDWTTEFGPFDFSVNLSRLPLAAVEYCLAWTGSYEFLVNTVQTYTQSSDSFEWFLPQFLFLQAFGGSVGCVVVNGMWGLRVEGAHLDWKLNTNDFGDANDWLQATANFTYSYVPREGRNSDDAERRKFGYISKEASMNELLYKNEGYFATARSELVYKPARFTDVGFFPSLGQIPLLGNRLGLQPEPDMWSPRWTARLRPVNLPGEKLKSSTYNKGGAGAPAGFNTMVNDSIPYLLMGAAIGGLASGEKFSLASGAQDLLYLWRASRTFDDTRTRGISK